MMKKPAPFLRNIGLCVLASVLFVGHAFAKEGIWISPQELTSLPTSGPAWDAMKADADKSLGNVSLSVRNTANVEVLAAALVYARIGGESYRTKVVTAINTMQGTEGSDALATVRRLATYIIAADLVGLDAGDDVKFKAFLTKMLDPAHKVGGGKSVVDIAEDRPNNWGNFARATRAAAALYLGDTAEFNRTVDTTLGWFGDRAIYAGFTYGDTSWQADPANPVGINPIGSTKSGHNIDGVLPDDQRRCGSFGWPPCQTTYAWEGLQGVVTAAVILSRQGYDVWNWEDQALKRSFEWLYDDTDGKTAQPAVGDDTWQPHIVNHCYGTNFSAPVPSNPGKQMGYTDWTHGPNGPSCGASPPVADKTPPSPPAGLTIN